ncbi:hypothetical protein D3C87_1565640 [compost metagenome]
MSRHDPRRFADQVRIGVLGDIEIGIGIGGDGFPVVGEIGLRLQLKAGRLHLSELAARRYAAGGIGNDGVVLHKLEDRGGDAAIEEGRLVFDTGLELMSFLGYGGAAIRKCIDERIEEGGRRDIGRQAIVEFIGKTGATA